MQSYDVAGYHIRGLLEGLRILRIDVDRLLRDLSIDRTTLEDPEVRFAAPQVFMLWVYAQQRYGKPTFGFDLACRVPIGKLELIDYLVSACPTVGAGIECLVHHSRLCASGFSYRIDEVKHEGEAGKLLVADHHMPTAGLPSSMAEYSWTCLVARFRQVCGRAFAPVLFLRERPEAPAAEQLEVLGRLPVIGDQEALFVPYEQWELPNPRRDPMLQKLLIAHAKDVAARLPEDDFLSMLQGAIVAALHRGDPSIERVASRLGLTARTLQRRLEAEGTAFQELLDKLRQELAVRYLAGTRLSLTEIGNMLAYSDATAFGRAFRRWTGHSPAAYRERERATYGGFEQPVAFPSVPIFPPAREMVAAPKV